MTYVGPVISGLAGMTWDVGVLLFIALIVGTMDAYWTQIRSEAVPSSEAGEQIEIKPSHSHDCSGAPTANMEKNRS